ncbi:hypothetical protein CAMGR0001_1146 [Campylobacter gracilis RM3268]|uniref:Uncharacterized protein n=1 Tax=Campylobacter gracilis RM3268 TaxID=553220 RepID=C8PIU7_9BACT|nr:hypothetical protein CAMGR0001_1146 [Campylobacter gracilis RM3268]
MCLHKNSFLNTNSKIIAQLRLNFKIRIFMSLQVGQFSI